MPDLIRLPKEGCVMKNAEAEGGVSPRALRIPEFSKRYGICRSHVYDEIKSGRLRALKCNHRTLISSEDAERWLRGLPAFGNKQRAKGGRS
jgi:hypothetical protein